MEWIGLISAAAVLKEAEKIKNQDDPNMPQFRGGVEKWRQSLKR